MIHEGEAWVNVGLSREGKYYFHGARSTDTLSRIEKTNQTGGQ